MGNGIRIFDGICPGASLTSLRNSKYIVLRMFSIENVFIPTHIWHWILVSSSPSVLIGTNLTTCHLSAEISTSSNRVYEDHGSLEADGATGHM